MVHAHDALNLDLHCVAIEYTEFTDASRNFLLIESNALWYVYCIMFVILCTFVFYLLFS